MNNATTTTTTRSQKMNDRNQAFKMTKAVAEIFIRDLQDHKGDIGREDIRLQVSRAVGAHLIMRPFDDASGISTASQEIMVSELGWMATSAALEIGPASTPAD